MTGFDRTGLKIDQEHDVSGYTLAVFFLLGFNLAGVCGSFLISYCNSSSLISLLLCWRLISLVLFPTAFQTESLSKT